MSVNESHSLRGECGLKFIYVGSYSLKGMSLSARRVWIEILMVRFQNALRCVTLCEESVD